MSRQNWSRDELLVAFNFYCRTPFGRLHRSNPDIVRLSQSLGRTPSALAMKLVNFASFDPVQQARGVRGLANAARADQQMWDDFINNPELVAVESQRATEQLLQTPKETADTTEEQELSFPTGSTETTRLVRVRLVQKFFRDAVLTSYEFRCAVCRLDIAEMLNASHIIPWSQSNERRADPRNGLSLCALHDRAFDRGFISLDSEFRVMLSQQLRVTTENPLHRAAFEQVEGQSITMPQRFSPDPIALSFHREHIFRG